MLEIKVTNRRILACLTGLLLAMSGCSGGENGSEPEASQDNAAPVRVATVEHREMTPTVAVSGTVVSRQEARVSAEVEGRLTRVAEVGTEVTEGDVMANIDATQLELQVEEQRGVVAQETARLEHLEREEDRLSRLAEQNALAANQLDQVSSDRRVAESELRIARARLGRLEDDLSHTAIQAPFDGIVTDRLAMPGERVSAGDPVVRLVNPRRREVLARGPLEYLPFVESGDPIRVSWRDRDHVGTVRNVVRAGDELSRLFEMRVDVPDSLWPIGQTVHVALPTAETRQVLAVPRDALVLRRDSTAVFVVDGNGTARRVRVTPGGGDGSFVEVDGQVEPGDRVIVRGNERLEAGQAVNILEG